VATAVVGAVFSLIVCVFLALNYGRSIVIDTPEELELLSLKSEVSKRPDDEHLLSRIRVLDLHIRQKRARAIFRSRKGSYLLLGGIIMFLIGAKCSDSLRKELPAPSSQGDPQNRQTREATWSRWAVTGGVAMLVLGVFSLMACPRVDLPKPDSPYPSIEEVNKNWASFRGPGGSGISAYTNIPTDWDGETGRGILWKTRAPLSGNSSPVVWGDRVFLSGGDANDLQVYCFDAASGDLLWTGDVTRVRPMPDEDPYEPMEDTGFATPTVVTDGRRVCAIFVTGDVGCFDFNGRKVWEKSLGLPDSSYGYAASLAIYQNMILIQFDQGGVDDGMSELIALDGSSGRVVWRTKRPVGNSWSSPIVASVGDQFQVITCADPWVIAYNPADGEELWRVDCLYGDVASSPIYANGHVLAIEPASEMVAIRPDGRGDVTKTHIAWINEDGAPEFCSPVSNGELIFMLLEDGLLSCHKVSDGTKLWEEDLREYFYASPGLVGEKLYMLDEKGVMHIAETSPKYKELAKCKLGEDCHASPAFADGRIYIRGDEHLYCIGNND
jgi:outer membrane protein assembly factor BamB